MPIVYTVSHYDNTLSGPLYTVIGPVYLRVPPGGRGVQRWSDRDGLCRDLYLPLLPSCEASVQSAPHLLRDWLIACMQRRMQSGMS